MEGEWMFVSFFSDGEFLINLIRAKISSLFYDNGDCWFLLKVIVQCNIWVEDGTNKHLLNYL